jgi:hypothetical protein
MLYVRYVHLTKAKRSLFIRDRHIHSSQRVSHKNYDREGSVEKENLGSQPQGAWRQDELIGGNSPIVK